jgi:hypothetical protein
MGNLSLGVAERERMFIEDVRQREGLICDPLGALVFTIEVVPFLWKAT